MSILTKPLRWFNKSQTKEILKEEIKQEVIKELNEKLPHRLTSSLKYGPAMQGIILRLKREKAVKEGNLKEIERIDAKTKELLENIK